MSSEELAEAARRHIWACQLPGMNTVLLLANFRSRCIYLCMFVCKISRAAKLPAAAD